MGFLIIYVIILIILYVKYLDFKEAFATSVPIGLICIVCLCLFNYCFSNMENLQKLFIDEEVYNIAGINSDTIVYIDNNNNLAVVNKDKVLIIENEHNLKSWLTCIKLKTVGKVFVIEQFPEDWKANVVPKENL